MTLPNFTWTRKTNSTHGQITAVVDISTGPKPMSALGYKARTLNDKRRDFRLVIGDPNHPGKAIVNPVIWLTTPIQTQVNKKINEFIISIKDKR